MFMKQINYNINFEKILEKLQTNSVLLLHIRGTELHLVEAVKQDDELLRFYYNNPKDFYDRHCNDITAELYFIFDAKGKAVPTRDLILTEHQQLLLDTINNSTINQTEMDAVKIMKKLSVVLYLVATVWFVMFLTSIATVKQNPFDMLNEIEYTTPKEYKPGKYRVSVGDYSQVFNVTAIDGHKWTCEDGVQLWVSQTLDIWKGPILVLRLNNYEIEEVK